MTPLCIDKLSNAFIPNATPAGFIGGAAEKELQCLLKKNGGLWVGGKIVINATGLTFTPNGLNSALHEGLEFIYIPLADIRNARREFGWVTGIVVIEHDKGTFRFRCFGAKRVAESLASYVAKP
jgi:hypothetical protein